MFHSSTQKEHWLFKNAEELAAIRKHTNEVSCKRLDEGSPRLSAEEELLLVKYYQKKLVELCNLFSPPNWAPLPRTALATAVMYFKRFYIYSSVMDHHPQDVYLCCVFLAFKIDEYNITLPMFMETLSPYFSEQKLSHISEFILSHELFLLQKLKFHLTIHSPFRPLSGFIIDIKTRTPDFPTPDHLRKDADKFLLLSLHSDVGLLYPPSQVALTALWRTAKLAHNDIDGYMLSVLLCSEMEDIVLSLQQTLHHIDKMVLATRLPDRPSINSIDEKLSLISASHSSRKRKSEEGVAKGSKKHKHDESSLSGLTPLHS